MCFDDWSSVSVRREVQRLRHMWTQVAHGLYGHQPIKMQYLQLWNNSSGDTHAISSKIWEYLNRESSKYFITSNCIHTITRGAHVSRRSPSTDEILRMPTSTHCRWAPFEHQSVDTRTMFYKRVCSTSTTITSGYGITFMLSTNVGNKSASASVFGLESSGNFHGPLSATYQADWSTTSWYSGNCSTGADWCVRGCSFSTTELQRTMRKMSAVPGHVISRADCIASSVAGSNSDACPSVGTSEGARTCIISWQDFKQLWQRPMLSCSGVFERIPCGTLPSTLKWTEATSNT
jgi:hypothetical protein